MFHTRPIELSSGIVSEAPQIPANGVSGLSGARHSATWPRLMVGPSGAAHWP